MESDPRVLVVADADDQLGSLCEDMDRLGWRTVTARSLDAALLAVSDLPVDAAVVQLGSVPESGLEQLRRAAAPRYLSILGLGAASEDVADACDLVVSTDPHPLQMALRLEQMTRAAVAEEEFMLRRATFAAHGVDLPEPAMNDRPMQVLTAGAADRRFLALSNALAAAGAVVVALLLSLKERLHAALKRLSAAVVVNYQAVEDKGKMVPKALTPEQLEQMTALVRETIGFNRERGDSVNLMNTQFQMDAAPVGEVPLWKQPEMIDLAKSFAWPVGAVLFAALVLLGLVRPALKGAAPAKAEKVKAAAVAGGQLDALEAETPERPALPMASRKDETLPATPEQLRLEEARVLAKENPVAVANILKGWLNGDSAL